ncbi:VOC family protein [Vibrio sp.]|uniref:VOC family protein n=1 Tax=Vibrio sp. TaxID=678 RepID=UPI003D110F12
MTTYVEHANITVSNLEQTLQFIQTALPEFKIRHQGKNDQRWCHIGTDSSYLAIQEQGPADKPPGQSTPYYDIGINHIGIVVEDVSEIEQRLLKQGYRQNPQGADETFRRRIYFFDSDGIEWEFIQYFSDDANERNLYE